MYDAYMAAIFVAALGYQLRVVAEDDPTVVAISDGVVTLNRHAAPRSQAWLCVVLTLTYVQQRHMDALSLTVDAVAQLQAA